MGGYKTWAALEEVTAANMNTYLRDNSVPQFSSAAARTSAIASPTIGTLSYLTDTGSLEVYYGATTGWRRPWSMPWGIVGKADNDVTTSNVTTLADVSGYSITFTAVANRYYRATLFGSFTGNSAIDAVARVYIREGTTQLHSYTLKIVVADYAHSFSTFYVGTATAGSHTWKISVEKPIGATTLNYYTGSRFVIEDIGPSGNAPAA